MSLETDLDTDMDKFFNSRCACPSNFEVFENVKFNPISQDPGNRPVKSTGEKIVMKFD